MSDNSNAKAKYQYYGTTSSSKGMSHASVGTLTPGKLPEKREPFLFDDQVDNNNEKCTVSDQSVSNNYESDTMSQKDICTRTIDKDDPQVIPFSGDTIKIKKTLGSNSRPYNTNTSLPIMHANNDREMNVLKKNCLTVIF